MPKSNYTAFLKRVLLAGVFFFPAGAHSAPFWCDGDETDTSSPLSIGALEQRISASGIESNHDEMVALIKTVFMSRQSQIDLTGNAEDQKYLEGFHGLIRNNNGPEDFGFTYQKRQNRGEQRKLTTGVLIIQCSETPQNLRERSPTQSNIALASHAIHTFGYDIITDALPVVVTSIEGISLSYRNWLLDQGLAQWPWELAVNGWMMSGDAYNAQAPRTQVVFLRPSVGLEFDWPSQSSANVEASVGIEPIGFVRYLGDDADYSRWWGISALVTLGTGNNGAGVGGLIRYNNFWLGFTDRKGTDDTYIFVGLDFHKFLKSDDGLKADIEKRLEKLRKDDSK